MTTDYEYIFNSLPLPAAVCTPLCDAGSKVTDIRIDAVNKRFLSVTKNTLKNGSLFSTVKDSLTPDIDWLEYAGQCLAKPAGIYEQKAFYSLVARTHLKISALRTEENQIILCLTDISTEKETEQQLRRQNSRLEELTAKL